MYVKLLFQRNDKDTYIKDILKAENKKAYIK